MKDKKCLQIIRLSLQIILFIFLPTLYIEALNGVKQLYLAVIHQSFSMMLIPQLITIIVVMSVTLLLGRFFCGWMCAFGSFTDFIYLIFHKLFKNKIRMNEQADKYMKGIKYIVLVVLIAAVWSFNVTIFNTTNPWDAFGMLASVGKAPDFAYVATNLTAGFIILLAIIIASIFIERFFCRYLCPIGAIFAIVSKLKVGKIKKNSAQCGKCRICTNNCAMGIPLYKIDVVNSGECINCMKCITVCPRSNPSYTIAKNDVRPILIGAATVAVMTGNYYICNLITNTASLSTLTSQPGQSASSTVTSSVSTSSIYEDSVAASSKSASSTASANSLQTTMSGKYKNGTYHGSGTGFRGGTTTVSVTVSDSKITTIHVDSTEDDEQFINLAYSTVSQEIISNQSADVDAVSGATFSSNGIMQAVEAALSNAKA